MNAADIERVLEIEVLSFSSSWPKDAFANEVRENKLAHYFTGRLDGRIVAYGGIWVILEDSHVTTIAVHPDLRGRKLGEEMLIHLLDAAIDNGASWITLEVRESNEEARKLYEARGFEIAGKRTKYYRKPDEDALIMRRKL